jgi:hypothetical protein
MYLPGKEATDQITSLFDLYILSVLCGQGVNNDES